MDMTALRSKFTEVIKKYRYVILVVLLGIGLMAIPDGRNNTDVSTNSENTATQETIDRSAALEQILSRIEGAGKVEVLLSYAAGEKTVYQTDEDITTTSDANTVRRETVILSDGDRNELPLVQQVMGPEFLGAVVVCQGADQPSVRLAIVDAVSKATGLGADRITVLKMK